MLQPLRSARVRTARRLPRHRNLISRLDPDLTPDRVQANFENWVRMWLDSQPHHLSPCERIAVHRGITWDGQEMWLVRHAEKRFGFHAQAETPEAAVTKALIAWDERRRVRRNWPQVRRIARDLMLGRRRLEVRIEDAHASALCTVGIEGFLSRIGLGRVRRVSGRTAALLMLLEPQVGFVILAAHERVNGPIADRPPNDPTAGPSTEPLRLA